MTHTRNATLADLVNVLQDEQVRKVDFVVPSSKIHVNNGQVIITGADAHVDEDGVTLVDGVYDPTDVFDEGVARGLNIPRDYLRRMRNGRVDLYDANVNGWLQGQNDPAYELIVPDPRSWLVRAFTAGSTGNGIARAFLTPSYKILDNLDALMAVLGGVRDAGINPQGLAIDGDITDRRMVVRVTAEEVRALAPELLRGYRSPWSHNSGTDNPTVFAGFVISNSEVGSGSWSIVPRLVVQICSNGLTVNADATRKWHLGSRQADGVVKWSVDTQEKELALITAQTRDVVKTVLNPAYIEQVVNRITEQAGHKLTDSVEAVQTVTKKLAISEEVGKSILDFFVQGGQTTAGGVMQAVTAAAQTVDAETAFYLEGQALAVLEHAATL